MRTSGRPSWQISLDDPQVLAVALYVRDVAGISQTASPADLPRVTPAVSPAGTAPASAEVTQQWNDWWARALTEGPAALREAEPPSFSAFAASPALQELLQVHFRAAVSWSSGLHLGSAGRGGLPLGELVAEAERRAGRTARPFALRLDVVPVEAGHPWVLGPGHLLLPASLLDDVDLLMDRLRPVVQELV